MKISVLQENLSKAVIAIARGVASRPHLPVLSNLLLKAEKGKLTVISTDLAITLGSSIGGKIEEEGSITVPAKDFALLVSALPADRVDLTAHQETLSVVVGKIKSRMMGIAASEFPDISIGVSKGISMKLADFSLAMKQVLFSVSADEGRPILTGVKISQSEKGKLALLATDGYRLSSTLLGASGELSGEAIVIPGKVLSEVLRLASGENVTASVTQENVVAFQFDAGWVAGRLLAGEFPPAERIFPGKTDVSITVDREELERAVRLAAIFARESANIVRWNIVKGKRLVISARSAQLGENETTLDVSGEGSGEIAFNARYLLDWLASTDAEQVSFGMVDSLKPGLFIPLGHRLYRHVIMPVRTQKSE